MFFLRRMDTPSVNEFVLPLPTLSLGVATCEGIPHSSWITKIITLTNEAKIEVAKGIFHNVNVDLVIDMDGKPLSDYCVVV